MPKSSEEFIKIREQEQAYKDMQEEYERRYIFDADAAWQISEEYPEDEEQPEDQVRAKTQK